MPRRAKIIPFPGTWAANIGGPETAPDCPQRSEAPRQDQSAPRYSDPQPTGQRSEEQTLVEAYRCNGSEALIVRGLLESHGIPALLRSRIAHSVHPFTVGGQGEVIVFVAQAHAVRAKRLLTRRASQA